MFLYSKGCFKSPTCVIKVCWLQKCVLQCMPSERLQHWIWRSWRKNLEWTGLRALPYLKYYSCHATKTICIDWLVCSASMWVKSSVAGPWSPSVLSVVELADFSRVSHIDLPEKNYINECCMWHDDQVHLFILLPADSLPDRLFFVLRMFRLLKTLVG